MANDEAMDTGADETEETDPTTAAESVSNNDSIDTIDGSEETQTSTTVESTTDGTDTQPPTAESTAHETTADGTEIESARRLLNFNGTFPYDRHNREGEEESVSTEDFTGTAASSTEPKEAPKEASSPAVSGLLPETEKESTETEDEPMEEGNGGSLKDDSGAETEKENVAPLIEKESTSDVVMMNNQDVRKGCEGRTCRGAERI